MNLNQGNRRIPSFTPSLLYRKVINTDCISANQVQLRLLRSSIFNPDVLLRPGFNPRRSNPRFQEFASWVDLRR